MKIQIDIRDNIEPHKALLRVSSFIREMGEEAYGVLLFTDDVMVTRREYRKNPCYVVWMSKAENNSKIK